MRRPSDRPLSHNHTVSTPEAQERLRLVLDVTEMATWAWDLQTDALQADARLYALLGAPPDPTPTIDLFFGHVHPDDQATLRARLEEAKTCGGEYEHEFRIIRPDGDVRWLGGKGRVFCDKDGLAVCMLGVTFDVTDQKHTEGALRESEARFRTLADSAPVMIWVSDDQNRGTYFNSRWLAFTGRSMEQELGFGWTAAVHPHDLAETAAFCQRHFDTRQEFRMEFRLRRADGVYRWVLDHGVPRYTADGTFMGYVGSVVDIDDRKQAETAIRESEAHFRRMADTAPVLLWVTDPSGGRTFLSQSWYTFTGRDEETSLGHRWIEAVHPDDRETARTVFRTANVNRAPFQIDYRLRRHDGVYRWIIEAGQPYRDDAGRFLGFVGSVIDINDRKQAEVRAHYLAETGTLVEQTLDYEATLRQIAHLAVPGFSDWCVVDLLKEDGTIEDTAISHIDPDKVRWAKELRRQYPVDPAAPFGAPQVMRSGKPEIYPVISDDMLVQAAVDEKQLQLLREVGYKSVMVVPLSAGSEVIGAISFVNTESGRRFDEADLATANEIARRAGGALEMARLHATIRAREEEFAALANNIPQLAWMADENGWIFWYNERWYDYTGSSLDTMAGWGWQQVHHPDHVDRVVEGFKRNVEAGEPWEDLFPLRGKDGEWRWFLSRALPIRDEEGRITRWFGTNTDVTESRELEQTLRESEARFRHLAEALPDIVYTIDESGDTEYLNARWYEYTGLPPGTSYRQAAPGVIHPDDLPRVARAGAEARRSGTFLEIELRLRRHDGEYRWFITRLVPIHDARGRIDRWFGTSTDIHAQKAIEAELESRVATRTLQLERVNRELRERNRELQDFAYAASHDLQEPLRKIQAFTGLILGDYGDELEEQGRFLMSRIQDATGRMMRLIHDLLAFSRVQTQGRPFADTDLDAVLQDVLSDLEIRIRETGGRVESSPLPVIEADATQMRQLLQNLIGNALKFHRKGTAPVVTVHGSVEPPEPGQPAPMLQLTVADNGIGFDERFADRIFAPFQRLHGRSAYEGTGIGLAICRRITERHGGTITVQAEPDAGATFTVLLPTRHPQTPDEVTV